MEEAKLQSYRQALKSAVKSLRDKYHPEKIILFGSLTKKNIAEGSDIDLLIIKKTDKNPWERAREVERIVERKVPFDLLVYTPGEVRDRLKINDFFIEEILEKGEVVYEEGD